MKWLSNLATEFSTTPIKQINNDTQTLKNKNNEIELVCSMCIMSLD